jgi:hypothetical protein
VFGGVKLGKVIRKYLLSTDIGQLDQTRRPDSKPGECYSACAMAFLGGDYRYLKRGSILGFHRFFWEKRTENDADLAQIVSAMEVEYIHSMDVSTDLFAVASQAGRDDVIAPAEDDLLRLNVVNNGVKETKWTIESIPEGLYLKGERETVYGLNKFIITCAPQGAMGLMIFFDAGRSADEVMHYGTEALFIDSIKQIDLSRYHGSRRVRNGEISLSYDIDGNVLRALY